MLVFWYHTCVNDEPNVLGMKPVIPVLLFKYSCWIDVHPLPNATGIVPLNCVQVR